MESDSRLRRCSVLFVEPRETLDLDLAGLLGGRDVVASHCRWVALAPHLDTEVDIDDEELAVLGRVGETPWRRYEDLASTASRAVLARLLDCGLLISDAPAREGMRRRDEIVRGTHWRSLSAVAHMFSRWRGTDVADDARITRDRTLVDLVDEYGLPPPHRVQCGEARIDLPDCETTALDGLLRSRTTCRNFDPSSELAPADFAAVLKRVFAAHAVSEPLAGVQVIKRANPSGGGLHPLEAYLLLRGVQGVAAGLYHYDVVGHALEPLALLDAATATALAERFVAGQKYLSGAHALVVIAARFQRTFWKYRNHAKAYRVLLLEAGHVSQNIYLAATELGLGAFITAAINEGDIEQAFGLDPLEQGPIAVCGLGIRARRCDVTEFDPLGVVWDESGTRR
ncbi:putative peptide maturation dehydrogenase [Dokdonella fugitiva]|uniref:Putative peptide maturation dehydrogenase n=1 Tax=Dokdonella fugitiva TaxID=328517 RepID=A0A839ESG0_9GAMM|nr:putative peptide maturation dehydrogenase [Dokdonella fugitiva]MBA8887377.1 putative peptide maturation dehydrogenase [Dokdonella fugitiva]